MTLSILKKRLGSGLLSLSLSVLFVSFLAGQVPAAYRIASNVTLWPSQQAVPGKQVFQTCITAGDTQWAYFIYLPTTYDSNGTKKWPLLIFQEVAGAMYDGNGGNIRNMFDSARGGMNGGLVYDLMGGPSKAPYLADRFITLAPFIKSDMILIARGGKSDRMMGLYRDIIKRFKVDTTRISMMGNCAGSAVVWMLSVAYPKFPSAIVCMSFNDTWCSTVDISKTCILKDIPYRHYADSLDGMVPFHNQDTIYQAMLKCGGTKMQFIVSKAGTHEIWGQWGGGLDTVKTMYDWMIAQQTPTSVIPKISDKIMPTTNMHDVSATDYVEVIGLNGQILLKCQGSEFKAGRLQNMQIPGVRILRVIKSDKSASQMILPW